MNNNQQNQEPLLPRSGNYRKLLTYQKAEAIYDMTYYFCKNYLQRGDRTIDQKAQRHRFLYATCQDPSTRNHCQYGYLHDQTDRLHVV